MPRLFSQGYWLRLAIVFALISGKAVAYPCHLSGGLPDGAVMASWYGHEHHGQRTADGELFDEDTLTAAHPSLPLRTLIRVVNLINGHAVQVRITDRGPGHGRGIDLSRKAARILGMEACGLAPVMVSLVVEH